MTLEKLKRKFLECFELEERETEYCGVEKRRINIEPDKKIIKRSQEVPRSLIKDTENILNLWKLEV